MFWNNQCVWHPLPFSSSTTTARWFSITNLSALAADLVPRIVIDWRTEQRDIQQYLGDPKIVIPQFPLVPPFFHTLQICQLMPPLSTIYDFHDFGLIFAGIMHCLPQRLKSTLFEIFSTLQVPFGHPPFEKISNNIDFSLWGKQCIIPAKMRPKLWKSDIVMGGAAFLHFSHPSKFFFFESKR